MIFMRAKNCPIFCLRQCKITLQSNINAIIMLICGSTSKWKKILFAVIVKCDGSDGEWVVNGDRPPQWNANNWTYWRCSMHHLSIQSTCEDIDRHNFCRVDDTKRTIGYSGAGTAHHYNAIFCTNLQNAHKNGSHEKIPFPTIASIPISRIRRQVLPRVGCLMWMGWRGLTGEGEARPPHLSACNTVEEVPN